MSNILFFFFLFFFFNDTATTEIYTLSLHDALPISSTPILRSAYAGDWRNCAPRRSEEHTSELQSRPHLVCRLLLEKKKATRNDYVLLFQSQGSSWSSAGSSGRLQQPFPRVGARTRAAPLINTSFLLFVSIRHPPRSQLFPYTTLFR